MFQGASIPFIAKLCAAAVVTTGAGVATYEVAVDRDPPAKLVEVSAPAESLAFEADSVVEPQTEDPKGDRDEKVLEEPAEGPELETKKEVELEPKKEKKDEPEDDIAPEIVILHPVDGSHFDEKNIVFEGETEPGATVKAGRYEADVDDEGNWRIELILNPGGNRAVLTAIDAAGNVADASVTVHLDVEPEDDKKHEDDKDHDKDEVPKVVDFSASQKWGYCEEEVPYDVFWGTAAPNSVVHIVSAHGSAEVEVSKHGHWEKKVYFETAPRGDAFVVVVEGTNGRAEFEFLAKPLETGEKVEK